MPVRPGAGGMVGNATSRAAGLAVCSPDRLPQGASRCRWAVSRASPGSMRMHAWQAGCGGHSVKRCFPCCGAGGVFAGWLTAKGEPGFPLECAYACPAGRVRGHGVRRHSPCCGVRVSGRFQTAQSFFAALSPAQGHKNSACRVGTDAVRFQVMPRGLPGAGSPY